MMKHLSHKRQIDIDEDDDLILSTGVIKTTGDQIYMWLIENIHLRWRDEGWNYFPQVANSPG